MSYTACQLDSGISLDCRDSNGGIEKVYIATLNGGDVTYTLTSGSDCEVDSILEDGVAIPTVDWYEFQVPKQTSSYVETATISPENGTVFYSQVVTLVFNKLQCATRDQMVLLAKNTQLAIIVKDNNGLFWTCGLVRGAEVTAGEATTAVAYGDRSGYTLTITGNEATSMFAVDAASVLGL